MMSCPQQARTVCKPQDGLSCDQLACPVLLLQIF